MKVVVLGAKGQLGRCLSDQLVGTIHDVTLAAREEIDIADLEGVKAKLLTLNPDVVINASAYTAVDKAEEEADKANEVNNVAVGNLAQICASINSVLIHISTDYVFDGEISIPYDENDKTKPINVYGKTKLSGEKLILRIMETNAIIIRTSWLYSNYGKNFVNTIIRNARKKKKLNVINDQYGSPTNATDLAKFILKIVNRISDINFNKKTRIYHFSNGGECSWFDFASEIISLSGIDCIVNPVDSNSYESQAKRPKNTTMSKEKVINEFGINIKHWKTSLAEYFEKIN